MTPAEGANSRRIGSSDASARLYVTPLNMLARPNCGLDAVVRVDEHALCFALDSADRCTGPARTAGGFHGSAATRRCGCDSSVIIDHFLKVALMKGRTVPSLSVTRAVMTWVPRLSPAVSNPAVPAKS